MRVIVFTLAIYVLAALRPPFPVLDTVTASAKFVKATGSQSVNRRKPRKRKRVKRIAYAKPPMVYASPDKIEVYTQDDGRRELRRMEAVRWISWF